MIPATCRPYTRPADFLSRPTGRGVQGWAPREGLSRRGLQEREQGNDGQGFRGAAVDKSCGPTAAVVGAGGACRLRSRRRSAPGGARAPRAPVDLRAPDQREQEGACSPDRLRQVGGGDDGGLS